MDVILPSPPLPSPRMLGGGGDATYHIPCRRCTTAPAERWSSARLTHQITQDRIQNRSQLPFAPWSTNKRTRMKLLKPIKHITCSMSRKGFTALEIPGACAKCGLSCSLAVQVTVQATVEISPTSLKQPTQPLASRPKITRRQNSPPSHSNCLPGFVLME